MCHSGTSCGFLFLQIRLVATSAATIVFSTLPPPYLSFVHQALRTLSVLNSPPPLLPHAPLPELPIFALARRSRASPESGVWMFRDGGDLVASGWGAHPAGCSRAPSGAGWRATAAAPAPPPPPARSSAGCSHQLQLRLGLVCVLRKMLSPCNKLALPCSTVAITSVDVERSVHFRLPSCINVN